MKRIDTPVYVTCHFTSNERSIGWALLRRKRSGTSIHLLRCLLLLVSLELNEVLIDSALSLLAEINIYKLWRIFFCNCCLTPGYRFRCLCGPCLYWRGFQVTGHQIQHEETQSSLFFLFLVINPVTEINGRQRCMTKGGVISPDHVVDCVAVNSGGLLEGFGTFNTAEMQLRTLICGLSSFKSWPAAPTGAGENPPFHNQSD